MNKLKRTLALVATLAMATGAFASCGDDKGTSSTPTQSSKTESSKQDESSEESKADDESSVADESSTADDESSVADDESGDDESSSAPVEASGSMEVGDVSLATGGEKFTVAAWNSDDVPAMLSQWESATGTSADMVNFINFDVGGGQASEKYDNLFNSGEDLDVYFCEADWALKYINDDTRTAPLEQLGFTDANFADIYSYTDEIGKDSNGVRKGVSWQAAAGGFAYRTDLAEQYLGVTSPEEMQAKISNWEDFVATAEDIAEQSGGQTALADTLGGMWQVFAATRTTPWVVDNALEVDASCEQFANYAKRLWDCGGVTKNPQWDPSWYASGQDDSAMGFFVSTWGFGDAILAQAAGGADGATYGKWNVCQGPAPYFWGGTWIVVNPATDNAEEAQSFIKTFTVDRDQIKQYALDKPEYCNNMAVMQEIVDSGENPNDYVTDLLAGQNYFAVLHENAKKINLNGLITPYDATIKTDFVNVVQSEFLESGASWEDTHIAFMEKVAADIPDLQ
ncbi:MAG: carbohydrate ABC transporter substrate-binding protein [Ruminococcus sp.]|nr:carbohydrate ABC transporter substrate-binding protein [Ruminococcus sp.]